MALAAAPSRPPRRGERSVQQSEKVDYTPRLVYTVVCDGTPDVMRGQEKRTTGLGAAAGVRRSGGTPSILAPAYRSSESVRACRASPVHPLSWATVAVLAAQVRLRYGVELDETYLLGMLANEVDVADVDAIVARINRKRTVLRLQSAQVDGLTRIQLQVEHGCCVAGSGGFRTLCNDAVCRDGLGPFAVVHMALDHEGSMGSDRAGLDVVAALRVVGDRMQIVQAEQHSGERVDVTEDNYVGHWLLDVKVVRGYRCQGDCHDPPRELLTFQEHISANLRLHEGNQAAILAQGEALIQQALQKRQARAVQEAAEAAKQRAAARRASAADMSRRLYLWRELCGEAVPRHGRPSLSTQRGSRSGGHSRAQNRSSNHRRPGTSRLEFVPPVNSPELDSIYSVQRLSKSHCVGSHAEAFGSKKPERRRTLVSLRHSDAEDRSHLSTTASSAFVNLFSK